MKKTVLVIMALLTVLSLAAYASEKARPSVASAASVRWEYAWLKSSGADSDASTVMSVENANRLGSEGWELVLHEAGHGVFWFKRRLR